MRFAFVCWLTIAIGLVTESPQLAMGSNVDLISLVASNRAQLTGGNGDSWASSITPDGRYVLFASMANNLVTVSNLPMPLSAPPKVNVFLRDRSTTTTLLVSLSADRSGGGNGGSFPAAISADGNFALFESDAPNLATDDQTNYADVFLRNVAAGTNTVVSTGLNGGFANGDSYSSTMTPNGRYIAYVSTANNLVSDDTNNIPDVFFYDLAFGSNSLVSVGSIDPHSVFGKPGSGTCEGPQISDDGRFVAFYSTATNLVSGVASSGDIYVRDLSLGVTYWVSSDARGFLDTFQGTNNGASFNHSLSAGGRYVAFEVCQVSNATPVPPGIVLRYDLQMATTDVVSTNAFAPNQPIADLHNLSITPDGRFVAFLANSNGFSGDTTCVQVWDAQTGLATLASGDLSNAVAAASRCVKPQISTDGRFIVFMSSNTNMVTNAVVGDFHLYKRDRLTGTTKLLDAGTNGIGSPMNPETMLTMSTNGQFVAFDSASGKLAPGGPNSHSDVFVKNTISGTTEIISVANPAFVTRSPDDASRLSDFSLSMDGRFVAFSSDADNLASNDTNHCREVFVRDLLLGSNILVSISTNGTPANGISSEPTISGDGRYVAFTSAATNLVVRDTNGSSDIFIRDLQTGTTRLVSTNSGSATLLASSTPQLSRDGNYVLYRVRSASGSNDLYWRNLQANSSIPLTTNGVMDAAMTPDGNYVTFITYSNTTRKLVLWSSQSGVATNLLTGFLQSGLGISPDGNRIAYSTGGCFALNRLTGLVQQFAGYSLTGSHPGVRFSADGRWLVYALTNQVMVFDFQTGSSKLVSHAFTSPVAPGSGASDWPDISADGRWIAYRSAASNLVSGDANGTQDVFVYDQQSGQNTLLSKSLYANRSADNRSLAPMFSADGNVLIFQSWASDLSSFDMNRTSDLFAYSLLYLNIAPGSPTRQAVWLSWPSRPDKSYQAQYKTNLAGTLWQPLSGSPTNSGGWNFLIDTNVSESTKFYRVSEF